MSSAKWLPVLFAYQQFDTEFIPIHMCHSVDVNGCETFEEYMNQFSVKAVVWYQMDE